ncbi:MAG: tandem-95 repeat protein [Sedimentisphaerales bacterium]|nr:tandem-95 repeat protein [Sedimentisphaerales bacterium]
MDKKLIIFAGLAVLLVIAFVVIVASKANKQPVAEPFSVTTKEDTPVSITLKGSDQDEDPLTYSVITEPAHGRLTGTAPSLSYDPERDFNGQDSFTFEVNDGKVDSDAATVSITVTPGNDPPIANDDDASAQEDVPIVTIDVLKNDTDPDNDRLVVVKASQGRNGSVTINTNSTLTYAPAPNFSGKDTFTYTISDGKDGTDTANVNVTINAVNDAPSITSKPVETARVWAPYSYQVMAKDPDPGDKLVYSLIKKPEGMTINEATGLIEWKPTRSNAGTHDVTVRVADNYKTRAMDTQSFTITVASLDSPLKNTLTVTDCFNQKGNEKLSAKDRIPVIQTSDNDRLETVPLSYTCYRFTDPSIPEGAAIVSVVVYIEHFEDPSFTKGKLVWSVGTGWPSKPDVWASIEAPVRQGQDSEATDSWDVTSAVDTAKKINSLQIQVQNNDAAGPGKTSVDQIYAVVEWY